MTTFEAATPLGAVRGAEAGGLLHFTGIPYAQPPVGALRFAAPKPVVPWSGVLDATGGPVVAPQGPSRLVGAVGEFSGEQSEDCLQVSVTTPAVDGPRRPVMVWLHGGGFSSGGGALDWYDGSTLAREGGVVVVGVNYRLGPLGYLRVEGAGDGDAGLLDMVEALRWVRDNIESFGGDPDNVTVFGQSAGGLCTLLMLTLPEARGLFHRAILQSPPGGVLPLTSREARHNAALLHDALGYPELDADALRQRLTEEPAGRLLTAARLVAQETAVPGGVAPPYLPVADGFESTEMLLSAAARGAAEAGIPLIVGTTRDEALAMVSGQPAADVMTDRWFTGPAHAFAQAVAAAGGEVWVYRLDWAPTDSPLGACHCLELPLVFGTADAWAKAPMIAGADPAEQEALSARIRGNWLSFAATGEPGGDLPWPRYDNGRPTMIFDTRSGVVRDPLPMTTNFAKGRHDHDL
ncbi:carboxylesterase family protein [Kribbella sp. NBC_00482]|uniref:carboxylesterase/lipase family protein n=1 Tax=Kribbella sp. NBC_00482 TaxID=2975968 RepID=UPI002E16FD17